MSSSIFISFKDKIPTSSHFSISEKLNTISKETEKKVALIVLKNPLIGIGLSIFGGMMGLDRFYKGDIKFGVFKLGLLILYFAFLGISGVSGISLFAIIGVLFFVSDIIWALVDIYLVFKGIKEDNLYKILKILEG